MNPRYRETFHSHRVLFLLPVVLGAVFALWTALGSQTLYRSNSSLWSGTVSNAAAFGEQPPAVQDQGMLAQLLQTESFTHLVASRSPLQKYLAAHPNSDSGDGPLALLKRALKGTPSLDDRIAAALSTKRVTAIAPGDHLLQVSFAAPTPQLARATLRTLLDEFIQTRARLDKDALTTAQKQVSSATSALAAARRNFSLYRGAHPSSSGASDPQLRVLHQEEADALTQLQTATQSLTQASNAVASGGGLNTTMHVLDKPNDPVGPTTGKKKVFESAFAGAFAGAILSVLLIVILSKTQQPAREQDPPADPPSTNGHHPHVEDEERILVEAPQQVASARGLPRILVEAPQEPEPKRKFDDA
jgi:hypothetical protein